MTHENDEQLQRLAELLKTTQAEPDDPMRRLAEALVPDEGYSHQQAEHDLPLYVTGEMLGRPAARLYPALHRHLLNCPECAALHLAMLADMVEEPAAVAVPAPDLSFLPPLRQEPYLVRLRRYAEQAAEAVLAALRPASLGELALVAEVFFDRVGDQLGQVSLQPVSQTAFNFSGSTPPALRYLAATAVATYRLGAELPQKQVAALQAANQLEAAVHRAALRAAIDLEMGRDALPFANEYTRWLLQQIDTLPRPS